MGPTYIQLTCKKQTLF